MFVIQLEAGNTYSWNVPTPVIYSYPNQFEWRICLEVKSTYAGNYEFKGLNFNKQIKLLIHLTNYTWYSYQISYIK